MRSLLPQIGPLPRVVKSKQCYIIRHLLYIKSVQGDRVDIRAHRGGFISCPFHISHDAGVESAQLARFLLTAHPTTPLERNIAMQTVVDGYDLQCN